jgi:DNA invertase Pin-like site-specific DNA recombinase
VTPQQPTLWHGANAEIDGGNAVEQQRLKVLGYTRVSLDEQGERGVGLAAQRSAILAEVAHRDWELVEILEDSGYSGRDFNRPAVTNAMKLLRCGDADALVVAKLDRLSRSILDFTSIMARARKENWGVIALDCAVDTTTPAGEAMAHVMATFAQYERRLIAQRTSDALCELRSRGKAYSPTPFGFERDGDSLVVHAAEQKVLTRIRRLRAKGKSYRAIAQSLNRSGTPAKQGGAWFASSVRSTLLTVEKVGRPAGATA